MDHKSEELGRYINVSLLTPEQIREFKEIIREKLSGSRKFLSLGDSQECIGGVTRIVTGDEKRLSFLQSKKEVMSIPFLFIK